MTQKFNILMIAPTSFFGHYGGHIRILEETKALQARGHQVTIVTYYMGQDVPGITIHRTAPLPYRTNYEVGSSRHKIAFDIYLAAKALQVAWQIKPDIIHGHMHEGALIGGMLSRLWKVPLVFDFQGSLTGEMIDHGFIRSSGRVHALLHRMERFISAQLPQAILTSSVRAQKLLTEQFQVPATIIHPLPDCANLQHFNPQQFTAEDKRRAKQQLGIPLDRPLVVYLGLLADYQGTHHLVEAAAKLKNAGQPVHFLIMGYPNVAKYKALAQHLQVSDYVTFTGRVDYYRDAPRLLALGDMAVSAKMSTTEGSGKVLNYMALALPIVAYDTTVHREYLGNWGVYADAGNINALAEAISQLISEPSKQKFLGEKLYQRAKNQFSWQQTIQHVEQIYQGITLNNPFVALETAS